MADPSALGVAVAAAQAVEFVGLPEVRLNLAQAVIHLALAPKSNSVATAIMAAADDVRSGRSGPVPAHLRDASYRGAARLGHGKGYLYPHDYPEGVIRQAYLPDAAAGRRYYQPSRHGAEARYADRAERIRAILDGEPPPGAAAPPPGSAAPPPGAAAPPPGSAAPPPGSAAPPQSRGPDSPPR
jgi:putative ATPase